MSGSGDLINFDLIETHKENIQQLPQGRSARHLVNMLSPMPAGKSTIPSFDDTKTLNDAIRHEYEVEVQKSAESDDPLDVFDRYVKWTLNAYPSAQATPQSQLLPLLERATKAFLFSLHYKNDPRYLKLWLHYIRWFSDAPRETFAYLARHNIGEGLALFYEEFATWLESAGRWSQAEEIYTLGIEREARPTERLMRKFSQFQQRLGARPQDVDEPTSPALPTVRPALAAKIDPFASTPRSSESQAARTAQGSGSGASCRAGKPKMAIFSDADEVTPPATAPATKGWQSIGSLQERKKENTVEAKPWVGEVLKAGTRVGIAEKMTIFKDKTSPVNGKKRSDAISNLPPTVVNSKTGKPERVFVDLEAVYPNSTNPSEEMSFDELRAAHRGWIDKHWRQENMGTLQAISGNAQRLRRSPTHIAVEQLSKDFEEKASIDECEGPQQSAPAETNQSQSQHVNPARQKRMKIKEIRQETQTIKANLASPTGPKIRRKLTAEPTMTFHSKAATNEVYDLFNQPLQCEAAKDDTQSGEESDFDDDGYSTAGESTGTGMISGAVSESGNEDTNAFAHTTMAKEGNTGSGTGTGDVGSEWTEFSTSRHMPPRGAEAVRESEDNNISHADDHTFSSMPVEHTLSEDGLSAPVEHVTQPEDTKTDLRFIPIPPENYDPTPSRTFRDLSSTAQGRLPFMTPIIEKTETSVAATNPYQKDGGDFFTSKTPSRSSSTNIDSPSKMGVGSLLLSSPVAGDGSPQWSGGDVKSTMEHDYPISPSPKSKRPSRRTLDECEDSTSPKKKVQITRVRDSPTRIKVKVTTSISPTSINQRNDFVKPALPEPKAAQLRSNERVITDLQCNPTDPSIRNQILAAIHPPPASYSGFFNHPDETFGRHVQLQRYAKKVQDSKIKHSPRKANDKTATQAVPPILSFTGASRVYAVKRELGQGAFAPVYLVDSYDPDRPGDDSEFTAQVPSELGRRGLLEAAKAEAPPSQAVWEFHVIHTIHDRLSSCSTSSRSAESIIVAHECHAFADEAYLILDYWPTGTLLDLVNVIKSENKRAGKAEGQGGLEEALAMFFAVELIRTVQDLHRIGILHGDLKGDNCLLRLPPASSSSSSSSSLGALDSYARDGSGGWDGVGLKLIDFGRGIDVTNFPERVGFIADWAAGPTDAPEIREARPWVWQIDLWGAAGVVHSLLFGKYMETVQEHKATNGLGEKKRYRLREGLKRYWQGQIWAPLFEALLNPTLPSSTRPEEVEETVLKELQTVCDSMEDYLELEGERKGLRGAMRKVEGLVVSRKK